MWRRQAALALNGTAGVHASGKGPSSYTAQLPTPTGRSVQQGDAMTYDRDTDRVWKLTEKIGFCLLNTLDGEDIRARPMAAHVDRDEHAIYFPTDTDSHKDEDIKRNRLRSCRSSLMSHFPQDNPLEGRSDSHPELTSF
jgi:hypothetical protein